MEVTLQNNYETIIKEPVEKQIGLVVEKMRRPGGFIERELYLKQQVMVKGKHGESIQKYHTPFFLCDQMLRKLQDYTGFIRGKRILIYNIEFLDFLYRYGIMLDNEVWFINENPDKVSFANAIYIGDKNDKFIADEFLKLDENMKFDIIVMNPPYQATQEKKGEKRGGGTTLWDKFVVKSLDLLNEDGYLCAVHPANWRGTGNYKELGNLMKTKQIEYLEIHDTSDGQKTFGAGTRYDWYVVKNINNTHKTKIKGQDGQEYDINISKLPFIPNGMFHEVLSLMAKEGEERVHVLHSYSDYESRKTWMNKEQTFNHQFPCVMQVGTNNEISSLWWSSKNNTMFGIPKVISGSMASGVMLDDEGKYGLTQHCFAIVDEPKNLEKIKEAMLNPYFIKISRMASIVSKDKYDRNFIKLLRKDFWKEFVNQTNIQTKWKEK